MLVKRVFSAKYFPTITKLVMQLSRFFHYDTAAYKLIRYDIITDMRTFKVSMLSAIWQAAHVYSLLFVSHL